MRVYEELFIVRPSITDEEIDPFIEQLSQVVTSRGGTVDKSEKWGVRKLAYRVEKLNEGYYVLLQFSAGPDVVKEMERRLRVADQVMKFITVRIDEKLKKIDKRRKSREKRASRKPAPQVAAPAMPSEAGVPMPGAPVASAPGAPVIHGPAPGAPAPAPPVPATSEVEK